MNRALVQLKKALKEDYGDNQSVLARALEVDQGNLNKILHDKREASLEFRRKTRATLGIPLDDWEVDDPDTERAAS